MSPLALFLVFFALITLVAGQLLLKWAVNEDDSPGAVRVSSRRRPWVFAGGILGMTVSFFVNTGLLQQYDLSQVFPFQGLSVIIVIACATFFLRERLSPRLIVGALLIAVGVALVSVS